MELLPEAVGCAAQLSFQFVFESGEFTQTDDLRRVDFDKSEAATVCPEGRCQNQRISRVILGTCDGETVAEAIHLFGIN
jgi:hypothetical protein